MSTKEKVLVILEKNINHYLSGEDIAKELDVSRASVWKAVKTLQNEGYHIDAITKKGYKLVLDRDILSKRGIEKYLNQNVELNVEQKVTSTNVLCHQYASTGEKEGYVLVAGMQTKGKGRTGHTFYSPSQTGIYLSIILRPKTLNPFEATYITSMAAVAACDAIEKTTKKDPKIKWINDIFIDNRKVAGILTEASFSMENGKIDYVIMGIGLNAYLPKNGFPIEIKNIAGHIFDEINYDGRNKLIGEFINSFMNYYNHWNKDEYYESYKLHSLVLNKEIEIDTPQGRKKVYAKDIDKDFELVIIENGEEKTVSSGEVHIKL